jgi:hypothetical protein
MPRQVYERQWATMTDGHILFGINDPRNDRYSPSFVPGEVYMHLVTKGGSLFDAALMMLQVKKGQLTARQRKLAMNE